MSLNEQLTAASILLLILFVLFLVDRLQRALSKTEPDPRPRRPKKWAIIDGSNVMYWKNGEPSLGTVRLVVDFLVSKGFTPGVMFDANAGYLLTGKYQHDGDFSRALGLPKNRVMVVPKGTQADPAILKAARDYKARVVTNDRFRDWTQDFPEIRKPGYLISGGFRSGTLSLNLDPVRKGQKKRKTRAH